MGMIITFAILMYSMTLGHHNYVHVWAISGMLISIWFGRHMRASGYTGVLAKNDMSLALSLIFLCYIAGPILPIKMWWDNRTDVKWYSRIVTRGYIIPTRKNRMNHFERLLSGELTE